MLKMLFQSLSFKPLFAFAALAVLTVWSIAYGAGSPNAADSFKLLWHSLSSLSLAPLQPLRARSQRCWWAPRCPFQA